MSRHMLAGALVGAIAMVGCVSIEKTKMRMTSADAEDVKAAEEDIYKIATTGSIYPAGLMSLEKNERLEYISLSSNEELMKRIASNTDDEEIFRAAAAKFDATTNQETLDKVADKTESITLFGAVLDTIDFKQPGVGMKYLDKVFSKKFNFYSDGRYSSSKSYWEWLSENEGKSRNSSYSSRRGYSDVGEENKPEIPPTATLAAKLVSGMTEAELIKLLTDRKGAPWEGRAYLQNPRIDGAASVQLIRITQSPETLYRLLPDNELKYENKIRLGSTYKGEELDITVVKKLFMVADNIDDSVLAANICKAIWWGDRCCRYGSRDAGDLTIILAKMAEDDVFEFAVKSAQAQYYLDWRNNDNIRNIEMAMKASHLLKVPTNRVCLLKTIFYELADIKKSINNSMYSWGDNDNARVARLLKSMPEVSEDEMFELAIERANWQFLVDIIPVDVAYRILASNKASSSGMADALLKRLPAEKVDFAVWKGIAFETVKNAAYEIMTPENKQAIEAEKATRIEGILAKAKEAEATTMCLGGFYLGMDYEEAKMLFAHYFPDMKIEERKVDNCNCFYCGQGDAFCFANKEDKVYEFNFGREVLTKWFQYDAARYEDWARAFSRENGVELKRDILNRSDKITVFTGLSSGGSPNYERVHTTLHQIIWTYKSAAKHYRLTYFDEPEIHAFGGGQFGEAAAEDKYKYISAKAGTLRAVIENK